MRYDMELYSTDIKELATALNNAQGEMSFADLNQSNPFFKNTPTDLNLIVEYSRPYLYKHGLSVAQHIYSNINDNFLITTLLHSSGQWIRSQAKINPEKNDLTHLRKICYAYLLGIVIDEGDCGEKSTESQHQESSPSIFTHLISPEQLELLEVELQNNADIARMVLKGLSLERLADMPRSKFMGSLERIRQIKEAKKS